MTKICSSCNTLLLRDKEENTEYKHHPLVKDLLLAVSQGCFICSLIWKGSNQKQQEHWSISAANECDIEWTPYKSQDGYDTLMCEYHDISNGLVLNHFYLVSVTDTRYEFLFKFDNIDTETSSTGTLDLAYNWFSECRTHHEHCNGLITQGSWMPTRILDIGTGEETQWRLCIKPQDYLESSIYMTLSYCWGTTSPKIKLLSSEIESFRRGNPIQELPQTFQDAIIVCRRFQIRYLWIDSLCIIQDSEMDWQIESAQMALVYTHSACNVAASASKNPSGGLFRSRELGDVRPGKVMAKTVGAMQSQQCFIFDESYWERHVEQQPLLERAWVLQERYLAPRVLHFSEHQILWECAGETRAEAFQLHLLRNTSITSNMDHSFRLSSLSVSWAWNEARRVNSPNLRSITTHTWERIVVKYSRCKLTNPGDKLVALSGIANVIKSFLNDDYFAGHWRSNLVNELTWYAATPENNRPLTYRAPSWSWAAVDAPIEFFGNGYNGRLVTVKDAKTTTSIVDPMGKVSGGYLTLIGPTFEAVSSKSRSLTEYCLKPISEQDSPLISWKPDALSDMPRESERVICMVFGIDLASEATDASAVFLWGLVLFPINGQSNAYRRIGYLFDHLFNVRRVYEGLEVVGFNWGSEHHFMKRMEDNARSTVTIL